MRSAVLSEVAGFRASGRAFKTSSEQRALRVWVADNNAALSTLLAQLLINRAGHARARLFPSANAVLAALAERRPPDTLLLDIHLDGKNSLSAIRPIKKLAPEVKVLILSMFSNSYYEAEAFRLGASGFLLKTYEPDDLVQLILDAHRFPGTPGLFPYVARHRKLKRRLAAIRAGARC